MKRSLRGLYWVAIACMLVMAVVAVALLLDFRVKDRSESLRDILEAVSAWTLESRDDLQSHANHIASVSAPVRVTFLSEAGTVIADSEHDAASMENHLDRPEVAAALQGGVGESLRLSDTQLAFMMYAAKRIAPGVILRLGYPVEIISHTLLFYSIGVVALAIILYILQRRRLTRFAVAMVRQMDDVRRLLEGATTDPTAVFPELQPALEHIAYLAKRLNSDLAEINRTLSLRDDFVANASHELRSPLTSIMGFAEMLGEGLADTPEEQALCLQTIRGECERMLDVVEDVLLLSRAEREQGLTREHVDVERVVEEVRRALAPQAAQKRISIVSEGALTLWAVEKDLWEILHNLMGNAIRYGRRGGHVKILLRQRCIIVEDDGIGIEKSICPICSSSSTAWTSPETRRCAERDSAFPSCAHLRSATARPSGWKAVRAGAAALRSALSRSRTAIEARFGDTPAREAGYAALLRPAPATARRSAPAAQARPFSGDNRPPNRSSRRCRCTATAPACTGENPVWP